MSNAANTLTAQIALASGIPPVSATVSIHPSIFADLTGALGSTAPVASTISAVLSHLGVDPSIISAVQTFGGAIENASGVDTVIKPVTGVLSQVAAIGDNAQANAQTAVDALTAAGIKSAADISANTPPDSAVLAAKVALLEQAFESLLNDVMTITKRIGL